MTGRIRGGEDEAEPRRAGGGDRGTGVVAVRRPCGGAPVSAGTGSTAAVPTAQAGGDTPGADVVEARRLYATGPVPAARQASGRAEPAALAGRAATGLGPASALPGRAATGLGPAFAGRVAVPGGGRL
jgi:hypothetical protein